MNSCEEMQLKLFFFVSRKFEFSLKWHKVSLTNNEIGQKKTNHSLSFDGHLTVAKRKTGFE